MMGQCQENWYGKASVQLLSGIVETIAQLILNFFEFEWQYENGVTLDSRSNWKKVSMFFFLFCINLYRLHVILSLPNKAVKIF